ncbi:MAG: nucleotidyltransferase domain-containing protein [Candidatus Bathyarchaeia archaeon]
MDGNREMLKRYEDALNELREKLVKELKGGVKSIIVYGSVARGEATEESDVDIMVVLEEHSLYKRVSDIVYEVDLKNRTATSIFWATPEELFKYAKNGSPFLESVAEEGVVLYDDGTFAGVRQSILGKDG